MSNEKQSHKDVGYIRHEVVGDGDCGFTAFGITREKARNLLIAKVSSNNDVTSSGVINLLKEVVQEELLLNEFVAYLKANKIIDKDINIPDIIYNSEEVSQEKEIVTAYINFALNVKKMWAHPAELQALAYSRGLNLYIWELGENSKLVKHHDERYAKFTDSGNKETKDLLYVNDDHFDLLTFNREFSRSNPGNISQIECKKLKTKKDSIKSFGLKSVKKSFKRAPKWEANSVSKDRYCVVRIWHSKVDGKKASILKYGMHSTKEDCIGHASLQVVKDSEYRYCSLWPFGEKSGRHSESYLVKSPKEDYAAEDNNKPDYIFVLYSLDIEKLWIEADPDLLRKNHPTWSVAGSKLFNNLDRIKSNLRRSQSCSGLVYSLLRKGGISILGVNSDFSVNRIITWPNNLISMLKQAEKTERKYFYRKSLFFDELTKSLRKELISQCQSVKSEDKKVEVYRDIFQRHFADYIHRKLESMTKETDRFVTAYEQNFDQIINGKIRFGETYREYTTISNKQNENLTTSKTSGNRFAIKLAGGLLSAFGLSKAVKIDFSLFVFVAAAIVAGYYYSKNRGQEEGQDNSNHLSRNLQR